PRRPVAARVVVARVALVPVRLRLEQRRPAGAPGALDRFGGSRAHGQHVVAVDDDAGKPVRGGACRDAAAGGHGRRRRELAVLVVLADVDDRQTEHGGEVDRLVEVGLVRGTVAEERDGDAAVVPQLRGERSARGGGERAADDREAAEQPVLEVDDVHRARAAAAEPVLAPEQLAEQTRRLRAEGEADADGHRLLPLVEVDRPFDLVPHEEAVRLVLEQADAEHLRVQALELARLNRSGRDHVVVAAPPTGSAWWRILAQLGSLAGVVATSRSPAISSRPRQIALPSERGTEKVAGASCGESRSTRSSPTVRPTPRREIMLGRARTRRSRRGRTGA